MFGVDFLFWKWDLGSLLGTEQPLDGAGNWPGPEPRWQNWNLYPCGLVIRIKKKKSTIKLLLCGYRANEPGCSNFRVSPGLSIHLFLCLILKLVLFFPGNLWLQAWKSGPGIWERFCRVDYTSPSVQIVSTKLGVILKPNWWRSILHPVPCVSLPGSFDQLYHRGINSCRLKWSLQCEQQNCKELLVCTHVWGTFVSSPQEITSASICMFGHEVPEPTVIFYFYFFVQWSHQWFNASGTGRLTARFGMVSKRFSKTSFQCSPYSSYIEAQWNSLWLKMCRTVHFMQWTAFQPLVKSRLSPTWGWLSKTIWRYRQSSKG